MQLKGLYQLFVGVLIIQLSSFADARSLPEFTDLVEEKSPAVVKITTLSKSRQGAPNAGIPDDAPEIFKRFFDPRRIPERDAQSMGSGFFISSDGYVLTNNHVVEGATDITVRLIDRREYSAKVIGLDSESDLALLKIDEKGLPFLRLADSSSARVGEWVLAIGSPFGLDYSVSAGIISAMGRSIPSEGGQNYVPFIQTDLAINPGNSGGPLFNLDGDVVGINSMIYTRSGGSIGLSFAIPSNLAKNVVDQLKDKGKVDRGWLGVVIQDVDKGLALSFGLDNPQGALIAQMEIDGPAERSGLKVSDIILTFNGQDILTSSDLPHIVGPTPAGSTVPVEIMRKGKKMTLDVTVGSRNTDGEPTLAKSKPKKTRLGLVVEEMTEEMMRSVKVKGVVITEVMPDSPAAVAGLAPGDILVQLGFDEVTSIKGYRKIEKSLPKNKPQPIRVIRNGSPLFRSIVIEK